MNGLDELIADHQHLHQLLALLKQQTIADDAADLHEVHAIVTQYGEYFARVHHPREMIVFEAMCHRNRDLRPVVEQALEGHDELTAHTDLLRSLLDEALDDGTMIREDIVNLACQFLDAHVNAAAYEELIVYGWARNALGECDLPAAPSNLFRMTATQKSVTPRRR